MTELNSCGVCNSCVYIGVRIWKHGDICIHMIVCWQANIMYIFIFVHTCMQKTHTHTHPSHGFDVCVFFFFSIDCGRNSTAFPRQMVDQFEASTRAPWWDSARGVLKPACLRTDTSWYQLAGLCQLHSYDMYYAKALTVICAKSPIMSMTSFYHSSLWKFVLTNHKDRSVKVYFM